MALWMAGCKDALRMAYVGGETHVEGDIHIHLKVVHMSYLRTLAYGMLSSVRSIYLFKIC